MLSHMPALSGSLASGSTFEFMDNFGDHMLTASWDNANNAILIYDPHQKDPIVRLHRSDEEADACNVEANLPVYQPRSTFDKETMEEEDKPDNESKHGARPSKHAV